jgi:hypothetical protein
MNMGQLVELGTGESFELGFEPVSIGRHGDNTIILPDEQVSRHHAEIVMQGGRWVISDLGSANGTYVNGQRIVGPQVLNHGDSIRLGQTQFRIEIAAALAAQDTLVELVPAPLAAPPPAKSRPGLIAALVAAAAVVMILLGALVVWPLLRGDDGGVQDGTTTPATSVAADATAGGGAPASSTTRVKPTSTALPTIAPPTREPTLPSPTAAPPRPTDTPAPRPTIGFLRASQTTIQQGECTRLEWGDVENATQITLGDVGRVGPSGKVDVCLDTTKTYTLQARGKGGTARESIEITVEIPTGPTIEYLRAIPSIISPGDCAQLEWGKVENSTSATIEPGIGGVATPGNLEVCPDTTTTYVLTAENPEGSSTAQTTLLVASGTELKPVVSYFTASPANIQAGECTTLSWGKVDYATAVTIDNDIGGVATPGSKEVCLTETTSFLLTAMGPGGTSEYDLTVIVSSGQLTALPDLVIESILFEPNPCYRAQKCKVRIKVRNDGDLGAGHFAMRWAPEGEDQIPVKWDVDGLGAGQEKELVYPWIPARAVESWRTVATIDVDAEVDEIEEGPTTNSLEQVITVLQR